LTILKLLGYKLQPTRCNFSWIYFYRRSTGFRRFLRPSSGAHNCTYSFRYCQSILLLAATVFKMGLKKECQILKFRRSHSIFRNVSAVATTAINKTPSGIETASFCQLLALVWRQLLRGLPVDGT